MKSVLLTLGCGAALLMSSGCVSVKKTLGFDHTGPDEFNVVPLAPLSLPADFNKLPSQEKAAAAEAETKGAVGTSQNHSSTSKAAVQAQSGNTVSSKENSLSLNTNVPTLAHEAFEATDLLIGGKSALPPKIDPSAVALIVEKPGVKRVLPQREMPKEEPSHKAPKQLLLSEKADMPEKTAAVVADVKAEPQEVAPKSKAVVAHADVKANVAQSQKETPAPQPLETVAVIDEEEETSPKKPAQWKRVSAKEIRSSQKQIITLSKIEEGDAAALHMQTLDRKKKKKDSAPQPQEWTQLAVQPVEQPVTQTTEQQLTEPAAPAHATPAPKKAVVRKVVLKKHPKKIVRRKRVVRKKVMARKRPVHVVHKKIVRKRPGVYKKPIRRPVRRRRLIPKAKVVTNTPAANTATSTIPVTAPAQG